VNALPGVLSDTSDRGPLMDCAYRLQIAWSIDRPYVHVSNAMAVTAVKAILGAVHEDSRYDLCSVRDVMERIGLLRLDHPALMTILPNPAHWA
jgi:hypothetical protein